VLQLHIVNAAQVLGPSVIQMGDSLASCLIHRLSSERLAIEPIENRESLAGYLMDMKMRVA
jgi:hypothetical protein